MSNLMQGEAVAVDVDERDMREEDVQQGQVQEIRPVPRITIQAFCESEVVAQTLESAARDRRMARAHVKVHMGGIPAAVDFYQSAPTPNLVIVESRKTASDLLGDLARLAEVCDGETKVVVIGHFNDIGLYRELVSNGVSEYLVAPISMADVMGAISDIFVNPETGPLGKLVAFIGAKGGCGSSTMCHNVAWSVAAHYENDVVLTDLDLAFGTANINLDQDPPQGVAEAVFSPERIDDILLDRLLAKCAEHLSLLAAPSTLERTYDFDKDAFNSILELAQRGAPYVVADVPHMWSGWSRQVLAAADEVVITAEPELANLRNTKNLLDNLRDLRPNDVPPRLLMNKVGMPKRPEISVADFTGALDTEAVAVLPFEPALFGTAANNGQMISEADPKHAIAESFDQLSRILTGKAELRNDKKGSLTDLISKLRGKKT
ncbi:MAG: CpaE family protein [Salaquimonas sp.]|nr:CpaE family protein [Salaquimonas sp.]